jgi:hypothetical protein
MAVPTTFDPANTYNASLSNGNLTVTTSGSGGMAMSLFSASTGKFHWEAQLHLDSVNGAGFNTTGIVNSSNTHNWQGGDNNGLACQDQGNLQSGGGSGVITGSGASNGGNDWYCVEVDFGAKLLWFKNATKNSVWNGSGTANPATGIGGYNFSNITGPWYIYCGPYQPGNFATLNAAGPFIITPSSGFVSPTIIAETRQTAMFPLGLIPGVLNGALPRIMWSQTDGLAAVVGGTRTTGTPLVNTVNRIQISTSSNTDAVTLGGAGVPTMIGTGGWVICNQTANTIKIFPPGASDQIDGAASVLLGAGKLGFYLVVNNTNGVLAISSGAMAASS